MGASLSASACSVRLDGHIGEQEDAQGYYLHLLLYRRLLRAPRQLATQMTFSCISWSYCKGIPLRSDNTTWEYWRWGGNCGSARHWSGLSTRRITPVSCLDAELAKARYHLALSPSHGSFARCHPSISCASHDVESHIWIHEPAGDMPMFW